MLLVRRFLLLALLGPFLATAAHAITLDWDSVTWTAGSLSNSYNIDPAKAGNDITVTISGDTTLLQPKNTSPNPQTPALTNTFQGGLGTAQNTLCLALNLQNTSQAVTVSVNFSALYTSGVANVSFTLFDIDFSNSPGNTFQDQLSSIQAIDMNGNAVAATITTSANNTLSGTTGLSQVVTGIASGNDIDPGSGSSNVTISFGATAIKSFTFTYGSGTGTVPDPTYQHMGIHDISFTPIPEINPAWSALGSCLVAAALILRHSGKFRK
jgi:hypothetical protein